MSRRGAKGPGAGGSGLALGLALCLGIAAGPRPAAAGCVEVAAGSDLQAVLAERSEAGELCLADGEYAGPVRLDRPVVLRGGRGAVIRARGQGTTVRLDAEGAALIGVTVDGSGGRFDQLDAAVAVRADDTRVEGVRIQNALFGVLVEQANRVRLRDNEIVGAPDTALGLRGDGIRLWEVRGSRIEGNRVADSRDLVVWYSPGNVIARNRIERGRYGTHFMYSHDNTVEDNRYVGNVVGIFVMYSRDLRIRRNLIAGSAGAAGVGLGAKESGNLQVVGNLFVGNTVGSYLDTCPLHPDENNRFEDNLFRFSDTALIFHASAHRNTFRANAFRDNLAQVRVEGRGDALDVAWQGNYWDDYVGYDLDGDGRGDVPYELRSLTQDLTGRVPALAFFRGTAALALVELVGRVVPLFQPRTLLVDPEPRMAPPAAEAPALAR